MKPKDLGVLQVDRDDGDSILVEFTDGTLGRFTAEELNDIQPDRPGADKENFSGEPDLYVSK